MIERMQTGQRMSKIVRHGGAAYPGQAMNSGRISEASRR